MRKVAVLIVVHNEEKFLSDLFESLDRQKYKNFQIICIDNNSQDNSKNFIRRNYPQIRLIDNSQNVSAAKAFNQGLKEALENSAEFVLLANPDMVMERNCLSALVEKIEGEKKLAAVQPTVLFWDQKEKINTSGNRIHFLGFGYSRNRGIDLKSVPSRSESIGYPSGPAHLWRAEVLKELGGFDEDSFLIEDLDLGWRTLLLGYQMVNVPEAIVYHKYSFSRHKQKYYFLEKGRLSIIFKNYKFKTLILISPAFFFMELLIIGYAFFRGFLKEKINAYRDFFKELDITLRKRKEIQKIRKVSDRQLLRSFAGTFESSYEDFSNPFLRLFVNPILGSYHFIIKNIIFW